MKELYLAGKIAELLAAFEGMKGVEEVVAGRAKASGELEVKCVRVQYNPKKTDICELLKKYFNEGVNPYIIAEDPLEQAAVIYKAAEDVPQIEYYARFMQNRGAEPGAALGNMILNDTPCSSSSPPTLILTSWLRSRRSKRMFTSSLITRREP